MTGDFEFLDLYELLIPNGDFYIAEGDLTFKGFWLVILDLYGEDDILDVLTAAVMAYNRGWIFFLWIIY